MTGAEPFETDSSERLRALGKKLGNGVQDLLGGGVIKNITPFAAGGVIGAPTYFPLSAGGLGLAGEAGPEAIMPLSRGPDGRLGIAGGAPQGGNITVQISTPDPAASAARKPTSPARSRARSRAASGAFDGSI